MARSCKRIDGPPGPKRGSGIGRNRPREGGLTRQVVALTDAVGHRIRFGVLPGQTHDLKAGPELRDDLTCEMLMGDKAFDADGVLETVAERGATAVIPPKSNRSTPRDFDHDADQERHRIETVFAKIKEAHSLATRYDKTRASFAAGIHLMAGVVAARSLSTGLRRKCHRSHRGRSRHPDIGRSCLLSYQRPQPRLLPSRLRAQ
ncbi:MAG: transposase, partial [Rhodobacteraceae bacterium]|nr:transposase [Paracoccaceae bacterium]